MSYGGCLVFASHLLTPTPTPPRYDPRYDSRNKGVPPYLTTSQERSGKDRFFMSSKLCSTKYAN